jgi:hypothetical protein
MTGIRPADRASACRNLFAMATKPTTLIDARARLHRAQSRRDAIETEYTASISADIDGDKFYASAETKLLAAQRITADMELGAARAAEAEERARFAPVFSARAKPVAVAALAILDQDLARIELVARPLLNLAAFAAAGGLESPFPGAAELVEGVKLMRLAIRGKETEFVSGLADQAAANVD